MALADAIQGGKRPSQLITWKDQDGSVFDLTGATITARIIRRGASSATNSDGTFTLTDASNGVFRWDYSTNDVAVSGHYEVQFTATFGSNPTPAKTFLANWKVNKVI